MSVRFLLTLSCAEFAGHLRLMFLKFRITEFTKSHYTELISCPDAKESDRSRQLVLHQEEGLYEIMNSLGKEFVSRR